MKKIIIYMNKDMNLNNELNLKEYNTFDELSMFKNETENELNLLQGIVNYGFTQTSKIQSVAIEPIYNGRDIIAQAQSGTGKTGTFVIGTLSKINFKDLNIQVIVITPSHELARQITEVYTNIGQLLKVKVELCIGQNISSKTNMQNLQEGRHVVVGTPGRIFDLINRNKNIFKKVKILILDEADKLLSGEFKFQLQDIITSLDDIKINDDKLQICIFSATLPEKIVDFCESFMNNPVKILIPIEELTLDGIKQYKISLNDYINKKGSDRMYEESLFNIKAKLICDINRSKVIPQGIIYVNSINVSEKLYNYLLNNGFSVLLIHRKKSSDERAEIMKHFKCGESRLLISTDLLARGIDIQQVMIVINFDIPNVTNNKSQACGGQSACSDYLHRIGRSGRYGRKGVAINFVASDDEAKRLELIEKYYSIKIEEIGNDLTNIF